MILLNALRGVSARITMAKTGSWVADVDVDLEAVPVMPTGPAELVVGIGALFGKIDARATGRFGTTGRVRLVGGAGWDQPIPALHLHNDAEVLSTVLYATVGAQVQETVVELTPPRLLGVDFTLMRGAASRVFAGQDWWVDLLGITHVGPRIPLPAPPTIDILSWDPKTQVAEIATDVMLVPGMVLTDPIRFGVATIDDVELTFNDAGGRAIAWCSTPSLGAAASTLLASPPAVGGAKAVQALGALARHACGVSTLKRYPYRVVVQAGERLNLQSTELPGLGECPYFLKLIDVWGGLPGLRVKLTPGSIVMVAFLDQGDAQKQQPVIVGFDPQAPPAIEVSIDALRVAIGEGTSPIVKLTPTFATWLLAVGTATGAGAPPGDIASLKGFTE
jgi:hypothetical protein